MNELHSIPGERRRAVLILARSLFRELVHNGFETDHVIALTTELLELTTGALRLRASDGPETPRSAVNPSPP
jgi:hypothetical protein